MAELKTKLSDASVKDFLNAVDDPQKRNDAFKVLEMMERITGEKGKMWGSSLVGFGSYHYKSERSRQEGDWPLTGFSPRKQNLTIYIMPGFEQYPKLMEKLGKFKTGKSCLYIKKLEDVDPKVLEKLVKQGVQHMKKIYG